MCLVPLEVVVANIAVSVGLTTMWAVIARQNTEEEKKIPFIGLGVCCYNVQLWWAVISIIHGRALSEM